MNDCNFVKLQGIISFEPRVKELSSGNRLGKLALACKASRGTLFIDVDVWDHVLISVVEQLTKGDEVNVTGELRSNSWQTPTGEKRMKLSVVAETLSSTTDENQQEVISPQEEIKGVDEIEAPF